MIGPLNCPLPPSNGSRDVSNRENEALCVIVTGTDVSARLLAYHAYGKWDLSQCIVEHEGHKSNPNPDNR